MSSVNWLCGISNFYYQSIIDERERERERERREEKREIKKFQVFCYKAKCKKFFFSKCKKLKLSKRLRSFENLSPKKIIEQNLD